MEQSVEHKDGAYMHACIDTADVRNSFVSKRYNTMYSSPLSLYSYKDI